MSISGSFSKDYTNAVKALESYKGESLVLSVIPSQGKKVEMSEKEARLLLQNNQNLTSVFTGVKFITRNAKEADLQARRIILIKHDGTAGVRTFEEDIEPTRPGCYTRVTGRFLAFIQNCFKKEPVKVLDQPVVLQAIVVQAPVAEVVAKKDEPKEEIQKEEIQPEQAVKEEKPAVTDRILRPRDKNNEKKHVLIQEGSNVHVEPEAFVAPELERQETEPYIADSADGYNADAEDADAKDADKEEGVDEYAALQKPEVLNIVTTIVSSPDQDPGAVSSDDVGLPFSGSESPELSDDEAEPGEVSVSEPQGAVDEPQPLIDTSVPVVLLDEEITLPPVPQPLENAPIENSDEPAQVAVEEEKTTNSVMILRGEGRYNPYNPELAARHIHKGRPVNATNGKPL